MPIIYLNIELISFSIQTLLFLNDKNNWFGLQFLVKMHLGRITKTNVHSLELSTYIFFSSQKYQALKFFLCVSNVLLMLVKCEMVSLEAIRKCKKK